MQARIKKNSDFVEST